jgi:hypothetical protein
MTRAERLAAAPNGGLVRVLGGLWLSRVIVVRTGASDFAGRLGHSWCVQDRYAGDLGDYLKFGLLRSLVPADSPASLRLGVVWYRTLDEAHNADGKHIAYLQPAHRSAMPLGRLDRDSYQRLAGLVASGNRSTAALAAAGVLTAGTCFFGDSLNFTGLPPGQPGRPCGAPGWSARWRPRRPAS